MSNIKFLAIYLTAMITTYLWRYLLIGDAVGTTLTKGNEFNNVELMQNVSLFLLFISYSVMAYVTYLRGKTLNKTYLTAFPIVGAVFDIVLWYVPFVPTVMNIITIVIAMPDQKSEATDITQGASKQS